MPAPKKRPTRTASSTSAKPTAVRRRAPRKTKDADVSDAALDNRSDDSHVDSVEVISPPAFLDPPPERRGRSRQDDGRFGANVDDDIVFPEDNNAPAPRPPQAASNDGGTARFDDRLPAYYQNEGSYPNQDAGGGTDREAGGPAGQQDDGLRRRRRRRRRGRGGEGETTNNAPQPAPRGNGQGQQRGYGQQRGSNGPQRGYGGAPSGGGGQQRGYAPQRGYSQQRSYEPRGEFGQRGGPGGGFRSRSDEVSPDEQTVDYDGVLELHPKGYGFLRDAKKNYGSQESDPFVSSSLIEKCALREGVRILGKVGMGARGQGPRLKSVENIDGMSVEDYANVKKFDDLTAITPNSRIKMEIGPKPITMRVMDLLTPVGRGQRALIVAPPRTGKTMLLQEIAESVSRNHPDMHLIVLLIDERPEEVTEMRRHVHGEVVASSLDSETESHVRISQLVMERAKRLAEEGKNVFILMDSITRTARAFNKWTNTGRTASGGLDVRALDIPKKMFGSARQFEEGGSLTIVATALIETGSRADDAIFQEFKGTGNMELVLSRDLADRRIWPSIDITKSGTRHEEKLYDPLQFDSIVMLRRSLISLSPVEAMEMLSRTLDRFPSNTEFLEKVKSVL